MNLPDWQRCNKKTLNGTCKAPPVFTKETFARRLNMGHEVLKTIMKNTLAYGTKL